MIERTTPDERKLEEIERLLNDPDMPFDPEKVWALLLEISSAAPSKSPAAQTSGSIAPSS